MPLVFECVSLPHDRDATSRTSSNDHGPTILWSMSGLRSPRMSAARNDPCSVVAEAVPCLLRIFVLLFFVWPTDVSVLDINATADLSAHSRPFLMADLGVARVRGCCTVIEAGWHVPCHARALPTCMLRKQTNVEQRSVTALQPPTMAMPRISRVSHQRVRSPMSRTAISMLLSELRMEQYFIDCKDAMIGGHCVAGTNVGVCEGRLL
jgi:hypothetical protein